MSISHSILIRLIRRQPVSISRSLPLLGRDDWSYRRGKIYGMLLRDFSFSHPIDLLNNRQAVTLAAWLHQYFEVQAISYGLGGEYILGACQEALQAIQ